MDLDYITAQIQSQQVQIGELLHQQRLQEALALAETSAQLAESAFGYRHPNTAATLTTIGACLSRLNQNDEAREVLERALDICESQTGEHSLQTAGARNNLSAVYRKLHQPRKALFNALETLRIRRGQLPANDPSIATTIGNLGFSLSSLGDLTAALACYRMAAPFDSSTKMAERNYYTLLQALAADPRFTGPNELLSTDLLDGFELDDLMDWCKSWLEAEPEEKWFTLRYGKCAHLESYQHYAFQLKTALMELVAKPEATKTKEAAKIRDAQKRLIQQIKLPVSRLQLTLKRIDRSKLGALSKATLECVFPNFSGEIEDYSQQLKAAGIELDQFKSFNELKLENLAQQGIKAEVSYTNQQFRRYAGDHNLPRNCYASICLDASGDDGQTLCRELYEYTDPRIPGFVFVGDTWDKPLMDALFGVLPGNPILKEAGIFVLLLPPNDDAQKPAYQKMYAPVLSQTGNWDGLSIVFIPTTLQSETLEDVVDLRQEATQRWFTRFFQKGDGAVFIKSAKQELSSFTEMLPALVYPEYGGSGVTKSIGSWMRLAGVNGLIFPSARSDVKVHFDLQGRLEDFHGWNFVDYQNTQFIPDREIHFDLHNWYTFVPGRQEAPTLIQAPDAWQIKGNEARYQWDRSGFIQLLTSLSSLQS